MSRIDLAASLAQLLLSSLAIFVVIAFAVEGCLKIFKVVNPRTRALCRCLPLIKLPLGIAFQGLLEKSIFLDLNAFSCKSHFKPCFSSFFFSAEQLEMISFSQISFPQFLAMQLPIESLSLFLAIFSIVTVCVVLFKATQFFLSMHQLNKICQKASTCHKRVANHSLKQALKKANVTILVSNKVVVPIAFGIKTILFPQALIQQFSQAEFEAVLAHELEHLHWKDPLIKTCCIIVKAVFWWVPMRWWLKRIDGDQEIACDASINRYGYAGEELASAVLKTLKLGRQQHTYAGALNSLALQGGETIKRFQVLLEKNSFPPRKTPLSHCGMAAMIACFFLIGFRIC
jgi:beta-lactamase regulating signal transducer with metallopeptidase domain